VHSLTSQSSSDSYIEEKTDRESLAQISAMKKRLRRTAAKFNSTVTTLGTQPPTKRPIDDKTDDEKRALATARHY